MAGLSLNGFSRKRLPELKAELEAGIHAVDPAADLAPQSVIGQILGVLAQTYADLWEIAEEVYLSQYAASAEGVALEEAARLVAVERLGPSKATARISATGTEGTTIPAGSLVKNAADQFETLADLEITSDNADRVRIEVTDPVNGETYTVTIDGTPIDVVAASNVASAIAAQLVAAIDGATVGADAVAIDEEFDVFATGDPLEVTVGARLAINERASATDVRAVEDGSTDVAVGALATIVTPVSGWDSVTNRFEGTDGRTIESDADLRRRRLRGVRAAGAASPDAITQRILQEVPGVLSAKVYENRTGAVVDDRPAHSLELVADGAIAQDIADKLWELKPAGIETYGTSTLTVKDAAGNDQEVKFSRPEPLYLWVKVTIDDYYDEEDYPELGEQLIADAVATLGNRLLTGEDVIRQRLLAAVYTVPGIREVTVELATSATPAGPPGAYAGADVAVTVRQRARFDIARVEVVE